MTPMQKGFGLNLESWMISLVMKVTYLRKISNSWSKILKNKNSYPGNVWLEHHFQEEQSSNVTGHFLDEATDYKKFPECATGHCISLDPVLPKSTMKTLPSTTMMEHMRKTCQKHEKGRHHLTPEL